MTQLRLVALALVSILLAGPAVNAASDSESNNAAVKSAVAGNYSCGFDSFAAYQAPGTNTSVNVGGVFTLTIDNQGMITKSDATLSVDDGGAGPAVCKYGSGAGKIDTAAFTGGFGKASLSYQAANANSVLCPSDDASITFSPVSDGLKFIYTNSSGFTGQGSCAVAAPPTSRSFTCNYNVKSGDDPGVGVGLSTVIFSPSLNQKTLIRVSAVWGTETYPSKTCPFFAPIGLAPYIPNSGAWIQLAVIELPNCPSTHFKQVSFTTNSSTISITAPGISSASCAPAILLANKAATIQVMPTALSFAGQKVKTTSPTQKVTITNTGSQSVNLAGFLIKGDFDQDSECINQTLKTGENCVVDVSFTPKATGKRNGDLDILSDAGTGEVHVKLTGVGQ